MTWSLCITARSDFVGGGDTFIFDSLTTTFNYNLTIVNDDFYEITESVLARLSLLMSIDRVFINPASAQVQIVDDDGKLRCS